MGLLRNDRVSRSFLSDSKFRCVCLTIRFEATFATRKITVLLAVVNPTVTSQDRKTRTLNSLIVSLDTMKLGDTTLSVREW